MLAEFHQRGQEQRSFRQPFIKGLATPPLGGKRQGRQQRHRRPGQDGPAVHGRAKRPPRDQHPKQALRPPVPISTGRLLVPDARSPSISRRSHRTMLNMSKAQLQPAASSRAGSRPAPAAASAAPAPRPAPPPARKASSPPAHPSTAIPASGMNNSATPAARAPSAAAAPGSRILNGQSTSTAAPAAVSSQLHRRSIAVPPHPLRRIHAVRRVRVSAGPDYKPPARRPAKAAAAVPRQSPPSVPGSIQTPRFPTAP